jgi:membrane protease YdiL (CAAX protease family)
MKNLTIYVPVAGLVVGELAMFYDIFYIGFLIDLINIMTIAFIIIFSNVNMKEKNMLQSLALLIILRIINLTIPQFFKAGNSQYLQYFLIYGMILIPIYLTIKNQNISNKELGINFSNLPIFIPIGIMLGIIVTMFGKINTTSLIYFKVPDLVALTIVMLIFIAVVEEIIFRSILQTRIEKLFGLKIGYLFTGQIFGIEHASYGILNEVLFASIIGIVLSFIFQRTRNIFFTMLIHGTSNVTIFGLSVVANIQNISSDIISQCEQLFPLFLILIISFTFLIAETRYWNKYVSNVLNAYYLPFTLSFIGIVVYKIMLAIIQ